MATTAHFPAFPSLLFTPHRQLNLSRWTIHDRRLPIPFAVRAASASSSVKKSRRKVKSNEELCNELMEFIAAVGLPQGHVPSMKQLSLNGRNDLAYIVRRRGYKLVRELLADSTQTESSDIDGNANSCTAENHDAIEDGRENIISGQDQVVYDVVEELPSSSSSSSSSKDLVLESDSGSLASAPAPEHDESVHVQVEFLSDTFSQEKPSYDLKGKCEKVDIGTNVHVSTVPTNSNSSTSVTSLSLPITVLEENDPGVPMESGTSWTSNQKTLIGCQDGMVENLGEEVSSSAEISVLVKEDNSSSQSELTHYSDEESYAFVKYPENLSVEGRVTNFMQNGDLGLLEDNICGSNGHEIERVNTLGNADEVERSTSEHSKDVLGGSEEVSKNDFSYIIRDDSSSAEGIRSLPDLDVKTSEREDQYDSSRLKFMLHQKELELSRLKEQIEKEQHTLSVLQANAETAIAEAQKLICEKDAELLAAEESLSGLVEVEIQYCGDGEIVEVTGSFTGWHHQINLDPEPSSSIIDHDGSRKPRLWSTMLWLYPGVYEMKFIVDGDWKIDPQREMVTRGTISNNILRVNAISRDVYHS